jgi:hypothetical protein
MSVAVGLGSAAACVVVAGGALTAHATDLFSCTITQANSSVTYDFSATVPFTGTLVGENNPARPPGEQTRTKSPQSFFSCGTFAAGQNDARTISGSIAAGGNNTGAGGTVIRPAGTFQIAIDPAANVATVRSLNVRALASGTVSAAATINNFTYQSFCTINPSCSAPFLLPISLPLGSLSVTALDAVQDADTATGMLTSTGPNAWSFSVPVPVTLTVVAAFGTAPVALDPQPALLIVAGALERSGSSVSITASTQISFNQPPSNTPTVLPPTPLTVPADSALCPNVNLVLALTVQNQVVTTSSTVNIVSAGTRVPCPVDIDANGSVGVQDIFDFLALWFSNAPAADFNGTGGITVQDIFDFLNAWFSPPLGC